MLRGIYKNSSSMQVLQDRMDVVANNLANVSTAGFKKKGVFLQQLIDAEQAVQRNQIDVTLSKDKIATYIDDSVGNIKVTGNPLDFAISSKGYFTIETPQGMLYTRNGQFKINQEGILVNSEGFPIVGEGGPIEINGIQIEVSKDGTISVDGKIVNRFSIKNMDSDYTLSLENGMIKPVDGAQIEEVIPEITQGAVEESNVNSVEEMVMMIKTHRHYDINARVIKAQDESLSKTVNQIAQV